jgi:hypothetical protein
MGKQEHEILESGHLRDQNSERTVIKRIREIDLAM